MMDRSASSLGETAGNIFYVFLPEMKKASQHQQVVLIATGRRWLLK